MIVAALDIGSNSVKLLVVDTTGPGPRVIFDEVRITRLSEGLAASERLDSSAVARTAAGIDELLQAADLKAGEPPVAVITAAGRRAHNAAPVVARLEPVVGGPITIASQERETALSRLATRRAFPELPEVIMVDLGGASTEIVLCSGDDAAHAVSVDLGSVVLSERLLSDRDPPSRDQLRRARQEAARHLDPALAPIRPHLPLPLVLVSGTATTLAAVHLRLSPYSAKAVHKSRLGRDDLVRLRERLGTVPLTRRQAIAGLHPARADVILGGLCIVEAIFEGLDVETAWVSDRGLRWGLIWEQIDAGVITGA